DQVVHDAAPGGGPLAGILAALTHVSTELAFVCPGDAPLLPTDLVARLASGMNATTTIVIPHDGERTQHFFMLLRSSARAPLVDFFARGGRSVHGWIATQPHCTVDAGASASGFFNVNTWGDLASVARAIGRETTRDAAHTRGRDTPAPRALRSRRACARRVCRGSHDISGRRAFRLCAVDRRGGDGLGAVRR